ncbi:MAG: ThiF family adenylyltransferase [Phycisphaerae bacterium]|nr:ThiF family adenylyltransferase [Phycisphaerae bacterium]
MNERYSRQIDIVPVERILQCRATVIGVGAVGRQVALQLTAIGIPHLQLVDYDCAEISNLASQGYLQNDLGRFKVDATADLCRQLNHSLHIEIINDRFKRSLEIGNIVMCCVDSIETRKHIFQAVKDKVNFFCDGRMAAESLRVITAYDESSRKYYPQTLFTAQQAYAEPCTAKTTIYCANIAAGFMLAQFTKYLRGMAIEPDVQINLLACEANTDKLNEGLEE